MAIVFNSIGSIRTPYTDIAPFRPDPEASGSFYIQLDEQYIDAISGLDQFSHIIIYFYFDRSHKTNLIAHPPHMDGKETGLFSSRSPNRINKIGMDVVELRGIEGNKIFTSPTDILDKTPLLDIKPYITDLDCFPDASKGHTP
jgi:tRNA-Thr(GGU) m(6)t(6)A37 methyltransferase TsaA